MTECPNSQPKEAMAKLPQKDIWSFGFQHWKDIWFPALAATAGCCSICPDSKSWLRGGNLFRSLERDQDRQEVDRVPTIAHPSPSPSPSLSPSPSPIESPSPATRGIRIGKRSNELPALQESNLMAICHMYLQPVWLWCFKWRMSEEAHEETEEGSGQESGQQALQ